MRTQFNCRLEPSTVDQIEKLAEEMRLSQADVVSLAIRSLARKELGPTKVFCEKREKQGKKI